MTRSDWRLDVRKLFRAIRRNEAETVERLVRGKPELVNCVARQPPKKDDGQSPLQVALKTGTMDIAEYLMDMGADVNFIEDAASCCNAWRAPVVHDAINCAVMSSRWSTDDELSGTRVFATKEEADKALAVLERMIDCGADVNARDSYGNSGLWRFCLQAQQILPRYNRTRHREEGSRRFTEELHEDLGRVLTVLRDAGADVSYAPPGPGGAADPGRTVRELHAEGPLSVLLAEVYGP